MQVAFRFMYNRADQSGLSLDHAAVIHVLAGVPHVWGRAGRVVVVLGVADLACALGCTK